MLWPAPAKINRFLHIVGRRADGYHLLQTVFQIIDLCDWLKFTVTTDAKIVRVHGPDEVDVEQDLTIRAAKILQEQSGTRLGVEISLEKQIPMGGGLGGGSSDAATVLVALNQLWDTRLSRGELARIGLSLGADVPVFVQGYSAWSEGVGEKLTPLELPNDWFVVIVPPVNVSTREVFLKPELTRNTCPIKIPNFLSGIGHNDCEPAVLEYYPEVAEAMKWLNHFGEARLTGTGACVFARFDTRQQAQQVLDSRPKGWQGFVAQGLNRSPLLDQLKQLDQ